MNFTDLETLLNDHQTGMSDFQDDYLVTARAGGTTYGQYKQALRELYKRFRGLRELVYGDDGAKILDIKVRKLERDLQKEDLDDLEREEMEINYRHKVMIKEESDRVINDTYREFIRFYQQSEMLKDRIGELTPERRRELETEMWVYRVKEMAAIDYLQSSRLKNTTIEFVSCLPEEEREAVYDLVFNKENHQQLISEYVNRKNVYELPFEEMEVKRIDMKDVEKLIEYKKL